jgi:hypothetical protein
MARSGTRITVNKRCLTVSSGLGGAKDIRGEIIQELRSFAERGAGVPELVELLLRRLDLNEREALFPVLIYFREAFRIGLREALPLREWLAGTDRSEVDSLTVPAIQRMKEHWQAESLQQV